MLRQHAGPELVNDAVAEAKSALRSRLVTARADLDPEARAADGGAIARWLDASPVPLRSGDTVGAYVSIGTEPDTSALLTALADRGLRVLVPVTADGPATALTWARYTSSDDLAPGRFGLREPTGERLPTDAVDAATLIFVPALAVDRAGTRLGRGAGYYDRSLTATTADLVAVVYDGELLGEVPGDGHDVAMGWALTPHAGFTRLTRPGTVGTQTRRVPDQR
ncbi:5-formyltetrahydrofolate cyclo-ligase [Williamsia sp. MIQD14]|uniref:5-formyltetrahydrofolate cyclo-ligase n=1 Tax=Williamsia sp. MIQD14 TaxID=3425703 RepID=UPI003DA180DA